MGSQKRLDILVPKSIHAKLQRLQFELDAPSTSQVVRLLLERGLEQFGTQSDLELEDIYEGLARLECLYEHALLLRGPDGRAAIEEAKKTARERTKRWVMRRGEARHVI